MYKPTVKELEKLVGNRISSDELLKSVKQRPLVNTFGEQAEVILELVNLIPAPGKESYFRYFQTGDDAIYWKSSENDLGVEIVGIVWDKDRKQRVICGIVLPP